MYVKNNPATHLLSARGPAPATGSGVDTRNATNYAYMAYWSHSPSAILRLEVSHDNTGWMLQQTVTAVPGTGTAQVAGYFPYVRGVITTGYSTSASAYLFYAPGLI